MKEGTGRGAEGSYRATATFSWEEGAAVPACVALCWEKVGAVHRTQAGHGAGRMWSLLADTWSSKRGSPSQESQLKTRSPQGDGFRVTLWALFSPGTKIDGM